MDKINNIEHFTKIGTFHLNKKIENQDSFLHSSNERYDIISLADGVSSCVNSKIGSTIACETVNKMFLGCGSLFFNYSCKKVTYLIMSEIAKQLSEVSKTMNQPIETFASTLCFACLEKETNKLMTFQLGDSNLYLLTNDGCQSMTNAKDNSSAFTVYDDADDKANVAMYNATDLNGVLLCSDGAWREFYDNAMFNNTLFESLKNCDFSKLKSYLENRNCLDDCSYILMNFNENKVA